MEVCRSIDLPDGKRSLETGTHTHTVQSLCVEFHLGEHSGWTSCWRAKHHHQTPSTSPDNDRRQTDGARGAQHYNANVCVE